MQRVPARSADARSALPARSAAYGDASRAIFGRFCLIFAVFAARYARSETGAHCGMWARYARSEQALLTLDTLPKRGKEVPCTVPSEPGSGKEPNSWLAPPLLMGSSLLFFKDLTTRAPC